MTTRASTFLRSLKTNMAAKTYSRIRHLAAPYDGPRFVAAEFSSTVYVWDLKSASGFWHLRSRLTSADGACKSTLAATLSPSVPTSTGELSATAADSGEMLWFKDKLKQLQVIQYSPDGKQLYCKCERRPLMIFDAETGSEIAKYRAAEDVYCSPYESVELVSKRPPGKIELRAAEDRALQRSSQPGLQFMTPLSG